MNFLEWTTLGLSAVLFLGVYFPAARMLAARKASQAPGAPDSPRLYAFGCAVMVAALPLMLATEIWGAWGAKPSTPIGRWMRSEGQRQTEPFKIVLLGQKADSEPKTPWTEPELIQVVKETVAIVSYFNRQYQEVQKTGDASIIRNDKALDALTSATLIFSIRGDVNGRYRPCYLALAHLSEGYMSLFDESGAHYSQWRQWMLENATRCEACLN